MPQLTEHQREIYNKWTEERAKKNYEKADYYRQELIKENIL